MPYRMSRRHFVIVAVAAAAVLPCADPALAQAAKLPFPRWVESFRARARARGVSDATYTRVMANLKPDMAVFALEREQPELHEEGWQYLNRRGSDWRIQAGQARARATRELLPPHEPDY